LRAGKAKDSLPSYLKSKLYLDFCNDDFFDQSFEKLIRHIYNEPKYTRQQIGATEDFFIMNEIEIRIKDQGLWIKRILPLFLTYSTESFDPKKYYEI
jgi:hypothetical protein